MNNIFYLEDHTPKNIGNDKLVQAVRTSYPEELLPKRNSELYIVIDKRVFGAKLFGNLEQFVEEIESERTHATVVSFGRQDYQQFGEIVDRSHLWGISETFQDGKHYRVHTHGVKSQSAPPKYRRDRIAKQPPQPYK